jgi:hypothetical protein
MSVNKSLLIFQKNSYTRVEDLSFLALDQSLPVSPVCFYLAALLRAQVAAMQSVAEA